MALHFFRILVSDGVQEQAALNKFLAQNHVMDIEKQFVSDGQKSHWAVCVTVAKTSVVTSQNLPKTQETSDRKRSSVDYKAVLSPRDFEVYATLRELRKQVAKDEGVPAYVIFTNAQLASMVTEKVNSKEALAAINGIGEARVDKHAETFVSCLQKQVQVLPSKGGVSFCGFRVTQGNVRLSRRRKHSYKQRKAYWEQQYLAGKVDDLQLQTAYAAVHSITQGTNSLAWRQKQLQRHLDIEV